MSSPASTLSTHVLDSALGRPGAGIDVVLDDDAHASTDADGRLRFEAPVAPGPHRLVFATGAWFAAQDRPTLYPEVVVAFTVEPGEEHYHVALLLGPWSYTTYRGS